MLIQTRIQTKKIDATWPNNPSDQFTIPSQVTS